MPFLFSASVVDLANSHPLHVAVVDGSGDQLTGFDGSRPTTATLTSVALSTTSAALLAANTARRGFYIHNDSGQLLYVAFAATATISAFTLRLPANGAYESPLNGYTGVISGIKATGAGNARITELT